MKAKVGQYVRATHDFRTVERGEITLRKGDVVLVSGCIDENWLCGRVGVREGNFPASFVQLVDIPTIRNGQKLFVASENFPAQVDGDLEFRKGDIIVGIQKIDSNWWKGRAHGREGIFPLTHADLLDTLDDLPAENVHEFGRQTSFGTSSAPSTGHRVEAKALVASTPQLDDELGFNKDDTIMITEVIDGDWYRGECHGHSGIFLCDCVQVLGDLSVLGAEPVKTRPRTFSRTTGHSFEDTTSAPHRTSHSLTRMTSSQDSPNHSHKGTSRSLSLDNRSRSASYNSENTRSRDNEVTPYAKTLYPFVSQAANELTFMDNEIVKLIKHVDDSWIEGEIDGKAGLFPASFVEIIVDCPYEFEEGLEESHLQADGEKPSGAPVLGDVMEASVGLSGDVTEEIYGLVLYDFTAETTRDLTVSEGDTIIVLRKIDDNWLEAKDESENVGTCPAQFVELIGAEPPSVTDVLHKSKIDSEVNKRDKKHSTSDVTKTNGEPVGQVTAPEDAQENQFGIPNRADSGSSSHSTQKPDVTSKPAPLALKPVIKPKPELKPKPAVAPKPMLRGGKSTQPRSRPNSTELSAGLQLANLDSMIKEELLRNVEETGRSRSSSLQSGGSSGSGGPSAASGMQRSGGQGLTGDTLGSGNQSVASETSVEVKPPEVSTARKPKPQKPAPPVKAIGRESVFCNKAYEDDQGRCDMGEPKKSVGQSTFFIESAGTDLDVSVGTGRLSAYGSKKPQPARPPPTRCPPVPISRASTIDDAEIYRRPSLRKPPPPRPTGPRVASAPPKAVMTPVIIDPTVTCSDAAVSPLSTRPSRPAPPRPLPRTSPPQRPPPKPTPRSPTDLMSFSPNSTHDKPEEDCEAVTDLRKRIAEVQSDLQKYLKSQRELEMMMSRVNDEEDRDEIEENLAFYQANITGLSEELSKLSGDLNQLTGEAERSREGTEENQSAPLSVQQRRLQEEEEEEQKRKREEEERRQREERRMERQRKRQNVIDELLQTEKDYLLYLQLVVEHFLGPSAEKMSSIDHEVLFGNMEEIADVAQKLLTAMEECVNGKPFSEQVIGRCFVNLAEDMKNAYAPYCRNHDDVHVLLEKYEENIAIQQHVDRILDMIREKVNVFDLGSLLIKPVQRILKYPLLLNELLKTTEDDHADKTELLQSINAMTDVATAINEYKRRKDLVFKYKKETEEKFGDKIAKLNLHSLKKKSTRLRARLSTNLGISLQTKDETFHKYEARFRAMDKIVRTFVRDVQMYLDLVQESVLLQHAVAADITDYYDDKKSVQEVQKYQKALNTLATELLTQFRTTVEKLVLVPLNNLVSLFEGPSNVIQKRFDKLLDYDSLYKKVKDVDKSRVAKEALQAAKNDYEAMNAQLLDELPKLHQLSFSLLKDCMGAFVRAQRSFTDQTLNNMYPLLELPMLLSSGESVMETFNIKHVSALDRISHYSFIPKGFNPRVEANRSEKRSKRNSLDPALLQTPTSSPGSSLPAVPAQGSPQSPSQKVFVQQSYPTDKTYRVLHDYTALNVLDLSVWEGDVVGVIKTSDPMGDKDRWFVDNGETKGFIPKKILTPFMSSCPKALDFSEKSATEVNLEGQADSELLGEEDVFTKLQVDWSAASTTLSSSHPSHSSQPDADDPPPAYPDEFYCAEYAFSARNPNEVSLFEGQVVSVISKEDLDGNTEWWWVDADGQLGFAPAAYLSHIEDKTG